MPTPYQVQLGNTLAAVALQDGNGGPYTWNGVGYVACTILPITTSGISSIAIYKSTDGHTWMRQDQSNEPPSTDIFAFADLFYPKAGGSVLYIVDFDAPNSIPSTAPISLHSFDMATNTYAVIATGGPTAYNYLSNPQLLMVRRSTGEFVVMYQTVVGGFHNVYYVTWSSGLGWGIPVLVSTSFGNGDSAHPMLIGIDAADNVYFVWYSYANSPYNTGDIYGNVLTGSSLSSPALIIPQTTAQNYINPSTYNFSQGWNIQGKYLTGENKIAWALPYWDTGADPSIIPTLVVADCAAKTFSTVTVHSYSLADSHEQFQVWIDFVPKADESNLRVIWTRNTIAGGNLLVTSDSTTTGGPWGAPATYYDEVANPPVPPPNDDETNSVAARYDTSGNFNVLVGLSSFQDGGSFQQAQFAVWAATVPVTLSCPVGGGTAQVGKPYTATLVVTGGTPPFTFAFIGSHPAWLSLNASTGVLSGTPTDAGQIFYTVQVTDANAQTSEVICGILVSTPACVTPLWRQDEFAMDAFNTQWSQAPAVKPRAFSVSLTPPVSMQVAPIPANDGVLDLCVVESGPPLTTADLTTPLSIADDLAWAVIFGALSDLLSQDGQSRAPTMAAYYEMRYQQALDIARALPSGLTAQVNNVPINAGSIFDMDAFLSNWQCSTGRPRYAGFAGRNLLALGPVPDGVYGITIDLVSNIQVPAADGDFVQVGREDLAYILDYAQHLASQKMAGQEFTNTMKLLKNFYAGGVIRNSRLKGTTVDKWDLDIPGVKQSVQYERTEGGSPMPTDNGST